MDCLWNISILLLVILAGGTSAWKKPARVSTTLQEIPVAASWSQSSSSPSIGYLDFSGGTSPAETIRVENVDQSPLTSSSSDIFWSLDKSGQELLDISGDSTEVREVDMSPVINSGSEFSLAVDQSEQDLFSISDKIPAGEVLIKASDQSPVITSGAQYPWSFDKSDKGGPFLNLNGESVAEDGLQIQLAEEQALLEQSLPGFLNPSKFDKLKWPLHQDVDMVLISDSGESIMNNFKFPKFDLPKLRTVIVSEEEPEISQLPVSTIEFPKINKGPVKEIPIHVYRLPPWPQLPKIEMPKVEPVKELPLVLYELPPLPEVKPLPLPEMKVPEIRIEKYILPPLPKLEIPEFPKIEPLKELPIVMYEFPTPDIKPLELPKIEPIKEIPIVMFDLPPLPKIKPIELPKIKMPEIKIIKKKLPPLPKIKPIEMPKLDLKLPEIKIVKYQMPKTKPLELPEIKFVKYEMPPVESPKLPEMKLPEFKLPEIKPLELPEFKLPEFTLPEIKPAELPKLPEFTLPEIKPAELPKLPEFALPEVYPMVFPPVQYMYAPVTSLPMPFPYQLITKGHAAKGFNTFGGVKIAAPNTVSTQPVLINSVNTIGGMIQGQAIADQLNYQSLANLISNNVEGSATANGFSGGQHQIYRNHPWGSQILVIAGNDAVLQGNGGYSKVYSANGNTGLKFDTVAPWTQHYSPFINAEYDNIGNVYSDLDMILAASNQQNQEAIKEAIGGTSRTDFLLPSHDMDLQAAGSISAGQLDKEMSVDVHLSQNNPAVVSLGENILKETVEATNLQDLLPVETHSSDTDLHEFLTSDEQTKHFLAGVKDLLVENVEKDSSLMEVEHLALDVLDASKELINLDNSQKDLSKSISDTFSENAGMLATIQDQPVERLGISSIPESDTNGIAITVDLEETLQNP